MLQLPAPKTPEDAYFSIRKCSQQLPHDGKYFDHFDPIAKRFFQPLQPIFQKKPFFLVGLFCDSLVMTGFFVPRQNQLRGLKLPSIGKVMTELRGW